MARPEKPDGVPPVPAVPQAPGQHRPSPYGPGTYGPGHHGPGLGTPGQHDPGRLGAPATPPGRSPYAPPPARDRSATTVPAPGGPTPTGPAPGLPMPDGSFALPEVTRPPLDAVSVTAVVTGVLALGPVALVLGIVGLRRTTTAWRRSPRIAGVGLGLGILGTLAWLGVAVAAGLGAFASPSTEPLPGDVASARTVHASALALGNCVEALPPQQEVGELTLVPCGTPHAAQVIGVATLDADSYPGPEAALQAGEAACAPAVEDLALDDDVWLAWRIVPTSEAWDEGVRSVTCLARSLVGPVTEDLVNG